MKRNKLCFLSAHLPSSKAKQAGQKIAYRHLKWLSSFYEITLISYANKEEINIYSEEDLGFCHEVIIVKIDNFTRIKSILWKPFMPVYISFRYNNLIEEKILDLYKNEKKIIFWLEYTQMCQYIPKEKNKSNKVIVVCHDILYQMFLRKMKSGILLKFLYWIELKKILSWEEKILKRIDEIVVLSKKDEEILRKVYGLRNVSVSYPKVDFLEKNNLREDKNERIIVFFGAMNRMENEKAVIWFVENIFPGILKYYPDIKFYIVGGNPGTKIISLGFKNKNIVVTGYLENPYEVLKKAWFSIAPLTLGAGVKIKVLECLSLGIPVIATTIGGEGIEAKEVDGLLIIDDDYEFLEKSIELLKDKEKCMYLGARSRNWFNTYYKKIEESKEKIYSLTRL